MNNSRFTAYYQAQKILPDDEWDTFLSAMRQHLPTTFRLAGNRQTARALNSVIQDVHVPTLSNIEFEGQRIQPPAQIPWYPDGLAWHFSVPKKVLRKQPEFKKFHSFLVFETEVGNISRQEGVSMLPPLFLDVEPHHKALVAFIIHLQVMDMCAAPGSKTAQILEALHAQDTATSSSVPTGLLLANDSDHKRTHLLIHQSARLPSPALMVTNLDASNYPVIRIPGSGCNKLDQLLFDRILCDVPCSGDGTMRKNIGIWKSWQPGDGNGLHSLQVRILQRAMKLLKEDGRIVYSTCSLNPIENEAVIAEALNSNPDFELVDVSEKLPALKRRPGITFWTPTVDPTAKTTYESYEAFLGSSLSPTLKSKLSQGHWPPTNVEQLNLHRCIRVYPHLQDTGGFFVAILEKKHTLRNLRSRERKREADNVQIPPQKKPRFDTPEEAPSLLIPNDVECGGGPAPSVLSTTLQEGSDTGKRKSPPSDAVPEKRVDGSFKENPYTLLRQDDPILLSCIERLHLTRDFPCKNILVRNPEGEAARSLYLVNDISKEIIQHNDFRKIRLTSAGTKVMAKQEGGKGTDAQFRVLGEGLPVILPFIHASTIITIDLTSLRTLIESYYPLVSTFDEPYRKQFEDCSTGSHVVKIPPSIIGDTRLVHELVLPIWKSNVSLTLMVDKKTKSALSMRLFGVDIVPKRGGQTTRESLD
ncbi:hypothetical protein AMATHDRAFT_144951 [Amanita thiersii Skay4041]|uniref:SAM-dependent MTase RsmB/NOP-type domain-containing protein n=1 Tax=Amanita thiersii Skay4041 TaxID=703135 RepID=A0A2A9NHM3_9AGAR|nr:hypothetical protein AMATHDRAFT_144951 [Amanita thiersii Skay4041]